jgi:hypothetical protein
MQIQLDFMQADVPSSFQSTPTDSAWCPFVYPEPNTTGIYQPSNTLPQDSWNFCPMCGRKVEANACYCTGCGRAINRTFNQLAFDFQLPQQSQQQPCAMEEFTKNNPGKLAFLVCFCPKCTHFRSTTGVPIPTNVFL